MDASTNRKGSPKSASNFTSRNEISVAEARVASGISQLYQLIKSEYFRKNRTIESDIVQGIDNIYLTEAELQNLNLTDYFPNQAKGGITIHIHKPGFIPYPPTLYIIKQKLKSFAMAANLDKDVFRGLWKNFVDIYNAKMTNIVNKKNDENNSSPPDSLSKEFNTISLDLMDEMMKQMMIKIYEIKVPPDQQNEDDFKQYSETIIAATVHHRTSHASILTFDEEQKTFSFDELYSSVTAHQRGVLDKTANLSVVYEGVYDKDSTFKVNHSMVKHASLAPIDAMASIRLADLYEENVDIIVSTCNHIEEVANVMATLRRHGRSLGESKPLELDWTYQLLTTNAFNDEKQATAYGYIVKAVNLMNGVTLDSCKLGAHVFNAGVNDWAEYNFGQHTDTQNRENVSSYLHLGKNFKKHINIIHTPPGEMEQSYVAIFNKLILYYEPIDPLLGLNAKFEKQLYELHNKGFSDKDIKVLKQDYEDKLSTLESLLALQMQYENELSQIAMAFNESRKRYNMLLKTHSDTIKDSENIKKQVGEDGLKQILDDLRNEFNAEKTKIAKLMKTSGSISVKLEKINKKLINHSQEYWDINKVAIQEKVQNLIDDPYLKLLAMDLDAKDPDVKEKATNQFLSIAVVVYKSYMDELFYSNRFREPKNGALFNAYLSSYLRVTGLMSSGGCKSANDRTYVVRLFIAALNNADKQIMPLPAPLHRDIDSYKTFCDQLSKIENSNSALYSCIVDTAGGSPKVDAKKFKYLDFVNGINYIGQFGKYAAHKILESIANLARKMKDKLGDNKFVGAYRSHKKAARFLNQPYDPLIAANDEFIQDQSHVEQEPVEQEKKKKNKSYENDTNYKFNE